MQFTIIDGKGGTEADPSEIVSVYGGHFEFQLGWYETYATFEGVFCDWSAADDPAFSAFVDSDP